MGVWLSELCCPLLGQAAALLAAGESRGTAWYCSAAGWRMAALESRACSPSLCGMLLLEALSSSLHFTPAALLLKIFRVLSQK